MNKSKLIISLFFFITVTGLSINEAFAKDRKGRLGVGLSNQFANDLTALSFKVQRSRSFSISGLAAINTDNNGGGHGVGIKVFKNLFDEPQLTFYVAALAGLVGTKATAGDQSGFQFDLTMGPEFNFQGLDSLGLSVEFGVSLYKLDEFVIETVGEHFVTAAVHFYL
jgi:hypothetical protein